MFYNLLCGMTADEISGIIKPYGFDYSHAIRVSIAVYRKRARGISEIENIPKSLRELLTSKFKMGVSPPVGSVTSADGTVKYLFITETGKKFETVFLPEKKRKTICVSTQDGCRMGCPFCLTGRYGFIGNLTAGEIVNQVIGLPEASEISHIVFMGMGEPMDNLEEVIKACKIITSEWGLSISYRNVTVSSVGITPGIEEFLEKTDCNLTVSLHSPFPDERKKVVPVENKYPVHQIIDIMKAASVRKKRRLSLAYVMIEGINDLERHLEALKELLGGSSVRINLLPYHKAGNDPNNSSSAERMQFFKHNLIIAGISASVRRSRGEDISAACGLLASGLKN